jgi:hemolysin activation/secretion protein
LVVVAGSIAAMPSAWAQENPIQRDTRPPVPVQPQPEAKPRPEARPADASDGPAFEVTTFDLQYAQEHPDRPSLDALRTLPVTLAKDGDTFVAPRQGLETVTLTIDDLTGTQRAARKFSVSAINAIGASVVQEMNRRGFIGVLVAPDASQIDFQTLADKRQNATGPMTLTIWIRSIQAVRTIGDGERWADPTSEKGQPSQEYRINHPAHQRIRDNSPLQPGTETQEGDLLRKNELDNYLYRLNRHPGRRVDAAVAAGDTPGTVVLDYIVNENRPWTAYAQVSNTGTKQTNEWRERFGFIHNQLTNRDDTFAVDYITSGFDGTSNGLTASYEAPFGKSQRLRYRIYGTYSNYTAADVGFADEKFKGENYGAGGEVIFNAWQHKITFLDLFGGFRWEHVDVKNEIVDLQGRTSVFIPYFGARLERNTAKASTFAEAKLEFGTVDSSDQIDKLGRLGADDSWTVLKWNVSQSFYLEPLLRGRAWEDPATPDRKATLAHEVMLAFHGQSAFGNRLIPQQQDVVGGMNSVRGYPESIAAGDTSYVISGEYRFHLPRTFAIRPEPGKVFGQPFRWAPQQRYGLPDWDLVFKGFIDVGRTTNSEKAPFERDETLVGIGPGVEFAFRRNLTLRADWGFALKSAGDTKSGDNRVHFALTLIY